MPRFYASAAPEWWPYHFARKLCKNLKCIAVVHSDGSSLAGYTEAAKETVAAAYDAEVELYGLAAPLKLNCSRYSAKAKRRIINLGCQLAIAEQVCSVARKHGMHCHGLGVALKPGHVKRLVGLGLGSFDSSSWSRPISRPPRSPGRSAKTRAEREQYFVLAVQRLAEAGVPLEGAETIPVVGGSRA